MSREQQVQGSSDSGIILALVCIVFVYFIIEYKFEWIAFVWRYLRMAEFWVFSFLPEQLLGGMDIRGGLSFLARTPHEKLLAPTTEQFDHHYAQVLRWYALAIVVVLGVAFMSGTRHVSARFNMEALLKRFAPFFSFNSDLLNRHPESASIHYYSDDRSPNQEAVSISPYEFATLSPPLGLKKGGQIFDGDFFDEDLARRAFDWQIGKPYAGMESLSDTERKIYDFLLPKLRDKEQTAHEIFNRHAFVRTGLMSMLEEARGGGVVACLEFRWLKYEDRTLWYALSSVGRKVCFTEAGGTFSHWLLEKACARAITHKDSTEAIEALKVALGLAQIKAS